MMKKKLNKKKSLKRNPGRMMMPLMKIRMKKRQKRSQRRMIKILQKSKMKNHQGLDSTVPISSNGILQLKEEDGTNAMLERQKNKAFTGLIQ